MDSFMLDDGVSLKVGKNEQSDWREGWTSEELAAWMSAQCLTAAFIAPYIYLNLELVSQVVQLRAHSVYYGAIVWKPCLMIPS
jgi:hypothetical protein